MPGTPISITEAQFTDLQNKFTAFGQAHDASVAALSAKGEADAALATATASQQAAAATADQAATAYDAAEQLVQDAFAALRSPSPASDLPPAPLPTPSPTPSDVTPAADAGATALPGNIA